MNAQKSKVIHFRKQNTLQTEHHFTMDNETLNKVPTYKYLGVILDEHLNFGQCILALSDSAGRALGATINGFRSLKNVGYETFTKLFQSGIQPIMDYSSCICM